MVMEALTQKEQAMHEKAIAKMRARLFRTHSPAEYFIVDGSERILPSIAESR